MKRVLLFSAVIFSVGIFTACGSKSEVSKKVKMEIINGNEQLTITTKENGKETIETFSGKEALEKMKEIEKESLDNDGKEIEKRVIISK